MMQFVAPAQLFLVLWLFAATAPAATALVNGSLVALIDAHTIDLQSLTSSKEKEEATATDPSRGIAIDLHGNTDAGHFVLLALAQNGAGAFEAPKETESFSISQEAPIAPSSAVLHTEVQRHRPRIA